MASQRTYDNDDSGSIVLSDAESVSSVISNVSVQSRTKRRKLPPRKRKTEDVFGSRLSVKESVSSVISNVSVQSRTKRRKKPPRKRQTEDVFGSRLSVTEIQYLLQRDEGQIAVELRARKKVLKSLLTKDDIGNDILTSLTSLLASISKTDSDDVREVFRFLAHTDFIKTQLLIYALDIRLSPTVHDSKSIQEFVSVLRAFWKHGHGSLEDVKLVAAVIHDTIRFGAVKGNGTQLKGALACSKEILTKKTPDVIDPRPDQDNGISVFPTAGEVADNDPPEESAEISTDISCVADFLEVHASLLRADIKDQLRKVISNYHQVKRMKGCGAAIKECRVYTAVQMEEIITSHTSKGISVRVQFDISKLQNVSWETTKILAYGSLVCLTSNHFHELVFATVAKRDPQWLKNGFIDLRPLRQDDLMKLISGKQFFMIDTQAYFEESYEILEALEQIETDSFPMAHHIVYLSAADEKANHLKRNNTKKYDLGPLLKDDNSMKGSAPRTWRAPLLEHGQWPTEENLNVDEHQLKAIQAALTKQVTVITGSPGTGKTYVGVKLTQLFLLNKHRWNTSSTCQSEINEGPVLFLCSTKATLDEFLFETMQFQRTGIVRCGGPYCRKALQEFNLEKSREKYASEINATDKKHNKQLTLCRERLSVIKENMDKLSKVILSEDILRFVIDEKQYISLKSQTEAGSSSGILKWLLSGDISEKDVKCLTDELPHNATKLASILKDDDGQWLERPLSCVFHIQSSSLEGKIKGVISSLLGSKDKYTGTGNAKKLADVWKLNQQDRWRLYRYWISEIRIKAERRMEAVCKEMTLISQECQKVHDDVDASIFSAAAVIAMTSSSAAKHRRALQRVKPQVVIVEEAADILQSSIAAVLPSDLQHLILMGENIPKVDNFRAVKKVADKHNVHASLIQHFVSNNYSVYRLQTQHRMSLNVSRITRRICMEDYKSHSSVIELPSVSGIVESAFFIEHSDATSPANYEASFLLALFDFLLGKGYARKQISIITTFPAQHHLFKGKVSDRLFSVDSFRGESDIVLFMCNGSERESKPGCQYRDQRLLSVLTRARIGLYIIGNFTWLATNSPLWSRVVSEARRLELFGTCLKLTCSNHPNEPTTVSTAEDIQKRREKRGCGLPCQARLECGHCCKELCHNHELEKASVVCNQPCSRDICEYGHKCTKLCSEPCVTKCRGKSEKKLPCGHLQLLPCHLPPSHATCRDNCERMLKCGHKCTGICGKPCNQETCVEMTRKSDWPCGHTVTVRCCDGPEMCPAPCSVQLACSHPCSGTCGKCRRGRLHVPCEQPCGRTLVCGHPCESSCSAQCPPCTRRCENKCQHSDCRKICGEACTPCREQCLWQCSHSSCPKLCGEPCERKPCDKPCEKIIQCGHPCIGICGEKCPSKCRICHKEEVTEILFGAEDEEDSRFVQLEDCGHVIEVDALDQYMSMSQEGDNAVNIQLKGCPKCKTPIRTNLRYGNIIKQILADIENVKSKIRGSQKEIDEKMAELKKKINELRRHVAYRDDFINEEDLTKLLAGLTKMRHLEKVIAHLNRCAFLRALADIQANSNTVGYVTSLILRKRKLHDNLDELKDEIVDGPLERFTEQQMDDLQREINRVNLKAQLLLVLNRNVPALYELSQNKYLISFDALVGQVKPFTKDDAVRAKQLLLHVRKATGNVSLGISEKERIDIVRAIGLSQGHWYKCPRGHVYAIGECGGAMEEASCPECGATIGGQSHRMTSGNRVATEMDGARTSAWPMGVDDVQQPAQDPHHGLELDEEDIALQFEIERQIREDREREERERRRRAMAAGVERLQAAQRERNARAQERHNVGLPPQVPEPVQRPRTADRQHPLRHEGDDLLGGMPRERPLQQRRDDDTQRLRQEDRVRNERDNRAALLTDRVLADLDRDIDAMRERNPRGNPATQGGKGKECIIS